MGRKSPNNAAPHPPNSHFKSEAKLVAALVAFLTKTSNGQFFVLAEHEGGFGRPDLLLYGKGPHAAHDIETLAKINPRLAPLFSPITSGRIDSIESLAMATGSSNPTARRIIRQLRQADRLRLDCAKSAEVSIIPISRLPFPEIVAIEAKLRDWRRALVQAYRYLQFSTESWVVLDHSRAAAALRMTDLFASSGVGLATYSKENGLFVHSPALNKRLEDSPLTWRTQAMLARIQFRRR
jgi:hypothetical protein